MKNLIIKILGLLGLVPLSWVRDSNRIITNLSENILAKERKIEGLTARKRGLTLRVKAAIRYSKATDKFAEQKTEDCDFLVNYLEVLFQAEGRCFNGQYFAYPYQGRDQTNLLRILNQVRAERLEAQEAFNAEQSIPDGDPVGK